MSGTRRVFLLIETSREYGRGLLRGIYRYHARHKGWQIEQQAPFYLETRERSREGTGRLGPLSSMLRATSARHGDGPPEPREADGIIMRDYKGSPRLLRRGIPIVFASYLHREIHDSHRIVPEDPAVGRMAAVHLLQRGFRRFAFVGYDSMYWSQGRKDGFTRTVAAAGHACIAFTQAREAKLRRWREEQKRLAQWLRELPKPIGLLACNDDRARQVVDACALAGVGVPEEVAIVGADNDEFVCNLSNPPISSVALGVEEAGYQAAELLDQLMKGQKIKPRSILVQPVTVVTRQSSDITAVEDAVVAEAVRFIRANCRRPLQVHDVLDELAASRRGLYDRFLHTLGCSVHQYIKKVRVAQIEAMLLETSHSVGEIAEILGFPSSEHIALYFRSVKGMNPHAFRERCGRG